MEARPLDVAGTTLEVGELPACRAGAGALVLLHEALGSVSLWRDLPERLAAATGMRVVAYSRAGHGRSAPAPRPRTAAFFDHEAHRVLPALLDLLGVRRPLLLGHSDGATIALLHAAHHRVRGAAILAPHVVVEPEAIAGVEDAATAYAAGGRLRDGLARHHDAPDALFEDWTTMWLDPAMADWSVEHELAGIRDPLLLVQGEEDAYATLGQLDRVAARTGCPVERLVLPGGHLPHAEHPEAVVAAVAALATRTAPGAGAMAVGSGRGPRG